MSHVKKGHLASSGEWAKHLRPYAKRRFWKKHRVAEKCEAKGQAGETHTH